MLLHGEDLTAESACGDSSSKLQAALSSSGMPPAHPLLGVGPVQFPRLDHEASNRARALLSGEI